MHINKTDYLFRSYARIRVFLHAEKNVMNYSDTSACVGVWLIFVFVYEKEICFSVLGGLDKLPFLSGEG